MININPKIKLIVGLILVGSLGALNALYNVEPTWKWVVSAVGVLGFLETFFTVPPAAQAKLKALLAKIAGVSMLLFIACTRQQAEAADAVAIDLTNAICNVAEDSPVGQPFTDVICSVATPVEQGIGVLLETDAGIPATAFGSKAPDVKQVRIRMPSSQVDAFVKAHTGRTAP